jgi:hypothetical protein
MIWGRGMLWKFPDERIVMDDQVSGVLYVNDWAASRVSSFFVPVKKTV